VPPGDDRPRRVCTRCNHVHYQNPIVVVGCLVERDGEILLCRRAIEPAHGRWTVPAGFLELGETLAAGAVRETMEEACADVEVVAPHSFLDLTHIGQSYAMFRARMLRPGFAAGEESLECRFVAMAEIPWRELAFPAVYYALRLRLQDIDGGARHVHHGRLRWSGEGSRFDATNYVIEEHLRTPLG
jgi:ADP-ribose/FAD diphosphatase